MRLWIHERYISVNAIDTSPDIIRQCLPSNWIVCHFLCRASHFGDRIDMCRYIISIYSAFQVLEYNKILFQAGYSTCITNDTVEAHAISNLPRITPTYSQIFHNRLHPMAIIFSSNKQQIESYSTTNLILDANFPALEPAPSKYENIIFG